MRFGRRNKWGYVFGKEGGCLGCVRQKEEEEMNFEEVRGLKSGLGQRERAIERVEVLFSDRLLKCL